MPHSENLSGLGINHQYNYFTLPSRTPLVLIRCGADPKGDAVPKMFKIEQTPANFASNIFCRSLFSGFLRQLLGGKG
jgi:hypothetical protein